jgi:PAS domain S-box-containing protein
MTLRFLLLEDNPLDADAIKATLRDRGIDCELLRVETRSNFIKALSSDAFDLILADYALPGFDGLSALSIARDKSPEVPFIFLSGSLSQESVITSASIEDSIEALKSGATDYVFKQQLGRLVPCIQRALREAKERQCLKRAELMLVEQKQLLELIALGHSMDKCLSAVCASVSKLNPSIRSCFLLTDAQRLMFNSFITPDFPPSFRQGLQDAPINELAIGTCGTAVYCGQPVTCSDIANDERWSIGWRELCVAHGILACHSAPVLGVDGLPLGSLMLCFEKAQEPTDWEYQLADFGAQVASIVFERDRSSIALRESEEKYRALFESIDEGFCICEMLFSSNGEPFDYRFLKVNPVFEVMTGLKEATGKTARSLVPNIEESWFEIYGSVVQTGKPIRFEDRSIAMNRWFDVNAFCIGEEQSNQFAILFTDISIRKKFEQERERFLALGSDLQVITSIDGYFQWVSPTFERTLGWTIDEMTSCPWTDFIHPDDTSKSVSEANSLFLGNETFAFENRYRHKDGSYRWLLWKAQSYPEGQVIYGAAVDITERKQAEEALRQSESRFRLMVESAKEYAIFTFDLDGTITSWNYGAERLLGYTEAEIIGCKARMIFTPEDKKLLRAESEMQTALTQGQAENECWHVRKDSSRFWASGLTMPLLSSEGNVQGFVKILQDKTAQRLAGERLELLYETTRDLLATYQPRQLMSNLFNKLSAQLQLDYYYNYIVEKKDNQLMLHLKHYEGISVEAAESIEWIEFGQYLCGLAAQERRQIVLDQAQISTHPNAQLVCSMGITAYAGQPLIVQGRLLGTLSFASRTRTYFTPEEIDLLQSTCEQIAIAIERIEIETALRQTSIELERQLQKFNAVVSAVPDFIYMFDLSGRFIDVNKPLLDLWQKTLAEVVGKNFLELDYPVDLAVKLQNQIQEVIQTRQPLKDETPYTSAFGTRAYEYIFVPIFDAEGAVEMVAGVTHDITESKRAEAERSRLLQQEQAAREAAELANRLKDEFLAVLSHELRSPLNPILGWTRLLQRGNLDAARQAEALATIERNAKLQAQLIEDLLDISRIMQGKLSLTSASVSLTFVISAAVETVRLAAEAKNIQITLDLDSPIASISGDVFRLQQVVGNLLTNAVKFTPHGGQVTVELRQIQKLVQIRVIDTGKGINPQFLPHVFEYFRQEDGSTTRKFGGLGLGLAIVRQIVEMHGGRVWAESRGENQGATFIVQLPAINQAKPYVSEEIQAQADSETPLNNVQILLVDDDTDTREFQAFLLAQNGAEVTAVASGLEALQALDRFIPNVLISDVGMPSMDGYMLIRQVRSRPSNRGGTIPAIALTAYAGEVDYQQMMLAGFQRHVTKPVDPATLITTIVELCELPHPGFR